MCLHRQNKLVTFIFQFCGHDYEAAATSVSAFVWAFDASICWSIFDKTPGWNADQINWRLIWSNRVHYSTKYSPISIWSWKVWPQGPVPCNFVDLKLMYRSKKIFWFWNIFKLDHFDNVICRSLSLTCGSLQHFT